MPIESNFIIQYAANSNGSIRFQLRSSRSWVPLEIDLFASKDGDGVLLSLDSPHCADQPDVGIGLSYLNSLGDTRVDLSLAGSVREYRRLVPDRALSAVGWFPVNVEGLPGKASLICCRVEPWPASITLDRYDRIIAVLNSIIFMAEIAEIAESGIGVAGLARLSEQLPN